MNPTENDIRYMERALALGAEGTGLVSPNPLVGCVIVSKDGEVVGEGTYIYDDVCHAEVLALKQAGELARGGTAYVSLEPHAHHGKTPPCTDALINAGIVRVVAPTEDPNPLVSGTGFRQLRESGIEVVTGVLAAAGERINEKFRMWHQKKRPFVHLKLAMSLDGRISLNSSVSTALSGIAARERVQQFRHEHDAILVGSNTAAVDDPALTDRSGKTRRRKLVRIVLDRRLRTHGELQLVKTAREFPTLVFTETNNLSRAGDLEKHGVEVVGVDGDSGYLPQVLAELKRREIQSVLVEGGTTVAGLFCDARLVDKLTLIAAPIIIGGNIAPAAIGGSGAKTLDSAMHMHDMQAQQLGDDLEITGYPTAA
ncbi:MAG: bifunctional diaminohydroxyphosphoribosylaminopyrimidine deaminase/5-amino-6-(5-phosphoribosylamino)uracil reductase RibD [Acidobacteriota bacterium]